MNLKHVLFMLSAGLLLAASARAQEPADGPFTQGIEYAQRRCVKIFGAGIGRELGYASGVIVSPEGHILTANATYLLGERIRVVTPSGREYVAQIERRSERLQTVLLKIPAETPDYFQLPDEPLAEKGDWVIALTNAYKVAAGEEKLSVNLGVVSLRTQLDAKRGFSDVPYDDDVLLIDAITSNPGSPGGALVTPNGQLAGMIGKIIEGRATNTRLNYAVPADRLALFVAGKLLDEDSSETTAGSGEPIDLGIRIFKLGGRRAPAYVDRVVPESPAAKAGIRSDDMVLSIGADTVRTVEDFERISETLTAGGEIELLVKRKQELVRIKIPAEP